MSTLGVSRCARCGPVENETDFVRFVAVDKEGGADIEREGFGVAFDGEDEGFVVACGFE